MNWIDLAICVALTVSVLSALANGIVVEIFSLAGLLFGLIVASNRYRELAPYLLRLAKSWDVASLAAFLLIAFGVMLAAGLAGRIVRSMVRTVGLGIFDRLLGAVFGLVRGCALIALALMAVAAFLPAGGWLTGSRFAPLFLAAAHDGSRIAPEEFGSRIRLGLRRLGDGRPRTQIE